jgi:cell division protein FtsW (lipid II flippase)
VTDSTEALVRRLSTGLKPVVPVASVPQVGLRVGAVLLAFFGLRLFFAGSRENFSFVSQTPWLWVETALLVGLALLAGCAIAALRTPGALRRSAWAKAALVGASAWLGVFTAGAFVREEGVAAFSLNTAFTAGCALELLLCALPSFGFFVWVARRGYSTSPWWTSFFAGLGALSLSLALLSWTCLNETFAHVAVWHVTPFVVFGAAGVFIAHPLLARRAPVLQSIALLPFALLAAAGVLLQAALSKTEVDVSVGLPIGGALSFANTLAGVALGWALTRVVALSGKRHIQFSWIFLALALMPTLLALAFGTSTNNLPFLSLGRLSIHATELSAALAVLSSAAFLSKDAFGFGGLGAIAPLLLLSSYGGPTGVWSYGIALATMWALTVLAPGSGASEKRGWNLLALVPLVPIAFLPVLRALRVSPVPSQPVIYGPWLVANETAGAHPQTDFALGLLSQHFGNGLAWGAVALFVVGCVLVLLRAQASRDVLTRLLATGLVVFLGLQAAWNVAAARGFFPTPSSGTYFPFLSAGESFTLPCVALLVFLWNRFHAEGFEETGRSGENAAF